MPRDTVRIALSFAVAAIVSIFAAPLTGGGSRIVDWLPGVGATAGAICLLFAGKLAFTLFSYASGAPGGIFLPMLSLGALVGAAVHLALPEFIGSGNAYLQNFILLGMAAFFVAVVRAPITGSVLITEMAGSPGHFPAFILVSVIAALVAELLGTKPIYDSLYEQLVPPEKSIDRTIK
jgi:H+/Cl- antiporter ClcA